MPIDLSYEDLMNIFHTKLIVDKVLEYYDFDRWSKNICQTNAEYRYIFGSAAIGLLFNFRTIDTREVPEYEWYSINRMIHMFRFRYYSISYRGSRCFLPFNYFGCLNYNLLDYP